MLLFLFCSKHFAADAEHLAALAEEQLAPTAKDWRRETFNMALRRVFADPSIGETSKIAFRRFVQLGEDAAKVAADLGITANDLYQIRSRLKQRIAEEVQTAISSAPQYLRLPRHSQTKSDTPHSSSRLPPS